MIDLNSSLYSEVALRYLESKSRADQKINVLKHQSVMDDEKLTEFLQAMKDFFAIYEHMAYSLKEDDRLVRYEVTSATVYLCIAES